MEQNTLQKGTRCFVWQKSKGVVLAAVVEGVASEKKAKVKLPDGKVTTKKFERLMHYDPKIAEEIRKIEKAIEGERAKLTEIPKRLTPLVPNGKPTKHNSKPANGKNTKNGKDGNAANGANGGKKNATNKANGNGGARCGQQKTNGTNIRAVK